MSLHTLANHMASRGRGDDSMLVHMTPGEVAGLQALAMKHGGSLTINPETGLAEAGFLKKLLPMIAGFALGPAGFGLMSAMGAGLTVGGATALATGSLSKGLQAGLGAYGGAGLGQSLMGAGTGALSAEAGNAALSNAGLTGEAALSAQADQVAQNAIGSKLAAATPMDTLGAGFNAITDNPSALGNFAKNNYQYGLAAMAPTMADQGVNTVTRMPNNGLIRNFDYDPMTQRARALAPVSVKSLGYADGGSTRDGSSQAAYNYLMGYTNTTRPDAPAYTPQPVYIPPTPAKKDDDLPTLNPFTPVTGGGGGGGITELPTSPLDAVTTNTRIPEIDTEPKYTADPYIFEPEPDPYEPEIDIEPEPEPMDMYVDDPSVTARDAYVPPMDTYAPPETNQYTDARDAYVPPMDTYAPPETNQYTDARDAYVPPIDSYQPPENSPYSDARDAYVPPIDIYQPTMQDNIGSNAMITVPDNVTNNYVPPEVADIFDPDIGDYVEVGDAGGDYGYGGDFGGIGGGSIGVGNNFAGREMDMYSDELAAANGGLMAAHRYATGGMSNLGSYSDGGRLLRGPGDGVSDSIPAMIGKKQPARLADGEFVVPARIVSELGNGSTEAGARKLYQMMDRIQAARSKTVGKGRVAKNSRADKHLPA